MAKGAGQSKPRIGLALGSGSARGWAHIGVIRALEKAGVRPDIVCGTSIGALVGAAYAAGELDRLERFVLGLRVADVVGLMDVSLRGGVLKGDRLMDFFRRDVADRPIEALPIPFAAVATSLRTGAEVWLRRGSTLDAVRASIALPALFAPVRWEGSLLVDGGLVNPVPVSLARAMGADVVIAVDLGSDVLGRRFRAPPAPEAPAGTVQKWMRQLHQNLSALAQEKSVAEPMPSILDVLATCMDITQVRVARSRLAGEPPEALVAPRLARLRLLDFHRAKEAIEEGTRAVERVAHNLSALDDRES
ncbi:MAG: patatin-like phospholipase RssA [Betaproteobacteria bacterium]|nr:MAG: patatin-like phospholipase RssA [Betaproteobacteria bacterium]